MTEIKTSRLLNDSKSGNFVFEPADNICNVQIFEKITMESCSEMVGRLAQIIAQLPAQKPIETVSLKIASPYNISKNTFVFDVMIDSPGGDTVAYNAISSMFALAKSRGAIVRTTNVGRAASAASFLAVQGTPGYRIMSEYAYNLIHYGNTNVNATRENELEIAAQKCKKYDDLVFSVYKEYTKLTDKDLAKYKSVEGAGRLFAQQCLTKRLCDWILTSNGQLIGRSR